MNKSRRQSNGFSILNRWYGELFNKRTSLTIFKSKNKGSTHVFVDILQPVKALLIPALADTDMYSIQLVESSNFEEIGGPQLVTKIRPTIGYFVSYVQQFKTFCHAGKIAVR